MGILKLTIKRLITGEMRIEEFKFARLASKKRDRVICGDSPKSPVGYCKTRCSPKFSQFVSAQRDDWSWGGALAKRAIRTPIRGRNHYFRAQTANSITESSSSGTTRAAARTWGRIRSR